MKQANKQMRFELGKLELFGLDLSSLWQRWWQGLNSLLPVPLEDIFLRPAPRVRVGMEAGQLVITQLLPGRPAQQLMSLSHAECELLEDQRLHEELVAGTNEKLLQLELVLPANQVLRRKVMVPTAGLGNLRQALGFQISKLTPFNRDQVFYDVVQGPASASAGMHEVELLVVPKAFAQPWLDQLSRVTGLPVARLQAPGPHNASNLLGQPGVPSRWYKRLNRNSYMVLLLVMSIGLAMLAPVAKLRLQVVQANQEIAALDRKVADTRHGWHAFQREIEGLEFMLAQYEQRRQPSVVLAELTRLIPDNVYLTSMTLDQSGIQLTGQGTAVVDLIEILNESALFEQARFSSAITRSRDSLDVFSISMQVAAAEQQP